MNGAPEDWRERIMYSISHYGVLHIEQLVILGFEPLDEPEDKPDAPPPQESSKKKPRKNNEKRFDGIDMGDMPPDEF